MATWKKVIVSGSNISQLNNDSLFIHTGSSNVALTGSFSGSFVGDGSGLTGVTAAGTLSSSAQIASDISGSFTSTSASIASDIVANSSSIATDIAELVTDSGSFSTRIAAQEAFSSSLDTGFASESDLNTATASLSASLATDIAALESFSSSLSSTVISYTGSFAGDGSALQNITVDQNATVTASFSAATTSSITHNFNSDNIIVVTYDDQDEQFLPSTIKAVSANVVEIHFEAATTGRAVVARGGHIVSGSIPYANLIAVPANIVSGSGQISVVTDGTGVVSGSAQLAADISGSFTSVSASIAADIAGLDGDFATDAELNAATASLSGSLATDIATKANSASFASDIATLDSGKADKTAITGAFAAASSSIATEIDALQASVGGGGLLSSSAQIAADISGSTGTLSASIASDIATNVTDIAGLNTYTSSLKTAITVSGADVTIAGGLTVSGTTTTVDSTTVDIGDNIIALNGTGATKGGLAVNDGPASGSLLWDGTNDYWVAGPTGSETKIFVAGATGDGLLSGSAQIASDISGSLSAAAVAALEAGILSGSAQIAANISGSFTTTSASIATDIAALETDSGSFSTRVTAQEAFSSSLGTTFATDSEVNTATASLSASLATDIATNLASIDTLNSAGLLSGSAQIAGAISGSFTSTSASIATDIATLDSGKADKTAVSGAFTSTSASIATDIATLDSGKADKTAVSGAFTSTSSSLASRIAANEAFSSSLDATFATEAEVNTATASLSASLAADIATNTSNLANLEQSSITTGSNSLAVELNTGSITLTSASVETLEIGDVYNQGGGQIDIRVPNSAGYLELNHGDADFIWLDGTDAGITLDNTYEWRFYSTGTFIAPGEIRGTTISGSILKANGGHIVSSSTQVVAHLNGTGVVSGSSQIGSDISGSLSATAIAALGAGIVSGSSVASSAQGQFALTTNGVAATAVDLGLQTTDSPTFAGLTVAGDLTVTGNTIEAQVTNLNVEDKYILLNSGSTSGDSGIVFGGADGVANQGVGLFWDTSYNSNDGRLGVVNSIAAGATGDQTPSYHIAGVFEGTEANAATAQADHVGNIRVESNEIYIYV